MDLEDFKFGRTKITSLRIVDESSPELTNIMTNWTKLAQKINMSDVKRPSGILVRIKKKCKMFIYSKLLHSID